MHMWLIALLLMAFPWSNSNWGPTRQQELVDLEDIRQVCMPQFRAFAPDFNNVEMMGYDGRIMALRMNSTQIEPNLLRAMSDDEIAATRQQLRENAYLPRGPGATERGIPPQVIANIYDCAFKERLCQTGRAKYCSGGSARPSAPAPRPNAAPAPTSSTRHAADLSGLWTGRTSGNQVTIEMRSGGFAILVAGQRRQGQYGNGQFFRDSGSGLYLFTKPDGNKVRVQVLGPDTIQVTNPDGWTDQFRRTPAARPTPPAPRPMASQQTMRDYAEEREIMQEIDRLKARYPQIRPCAWRGDGRGIQDPCLKNNYQAEHYIAMGLAASLEARRSHVSKEFYASVTQSWQRARDNAVAGCVRLSATTTPCAPPAGATGGSPKPRSTGDQPAQWVQQGKDARIIASDGKSAMHCVKLEQVSSGDSKVGVGGRRLFNYCPEEVEITWCNTPGCSTPTGGNTWTVQPNRGWPVSANGDVRWAACLGRDTAAFVKGSHGLRYYCTAPLGKPRK